MKRLTALLTAICLCACLTRHADAAELNCSVEINAEQLANASPETFSSLRELIAEYLNTTAFTTAEYSPVEKIECKFFFTITAYNDNTVAGSLQVQSNRPIFGSSYISPILNFKDSDISFQYTPGDRIVRTSSSVESNLAAILDFYAFLIIALDSDTFAPSGGEAAYEAAANIVQLARVTGEKGWRAIDDQRNRASLLAAITEGPASKIRELLYSYHRTGLDIMGISPDKGRAAIAKALPMLDNIAAAAPMSVALSMVRDAKLDEIVNIFSKGTRDERKAVLTTLSGIYPTEKSRLESLKD
jgi:hypothetical protein